MHRVFRLLIVVQSAFLFGFGTWAVVEWSNNAYLRDWLQDVTGNGLLVLMAATFTAWFCALTISALVGFRWQQVLGIVDSAEDVVELKQLPPSKVFPSVKPVHPTDGEFRDWDPGDAARPVQKEPLVPREEDPQTPLAESVLERRRKYVTVSQLRKRPKED